MKLFPRKLATQTRSKATIGVILQATRDLLESPEAKKLTTTGVAARAGVSIGSLYQYFPSFDSLTLSLMEKVLDEQIAAIDDLLLQQHEESLEVKIRSVLEYYLNSIRKRPKTTLFFARKFLIYGKNDFLARGDQKLVAVFKRHLVSHREELRTENLDLSLLFVVQGLRMIPTATLMTAPHLFDHDKVRDELTHLAVSYLKST